MKVYHGSTEIIKKPDVNHSKRYLDFGRGFYLTTYEEQAKRWAVRKASRLGKMPIVNVYEMLDSLDGYNVLRFEGEDEKWLDFICNCRRGEELNNDYDIIIGSVANDDVFKTVDMYFRGLWEKERVLKELRYFKMNDQICVVKQNVLEHALLFETSYEVK